MGQIHRTGDVSPISYRRWESLVYKYRESLGHTFCHGMVQLLDKARQMETEAVSLHIIYLRTSICNQRPYYRLYLMDGKFYNGNTDCWTYWEMPELVSCVENRFPVPEELFYLGYGPQFVKTEQKIKTSVETLYFVMGKVIRYFLDTATGEIPSIGKYPVYFGEYMGDQRLIRQGNQQKNQKEPYENR